MSRYDYGVIVIGGGTAGLISAYTANLLGAKVALVEAGEMGGDCLNTGCVPSKSLIASARVAETAQKASDYGVNAQFDSVDYKTIHDRIHAIIDAVAPNDSAERYRSLGIDVFKEQATWHDQHTIGLGGKKISARRLIIASGSRPFVPDIPGINSSHVYTTDTIWQLKIVPKHLVVIGGGPVGCELAQSYAQLGVKVSLVHHGNRLLETLLSPDQSAIVASSLQASGITVVTKANTSRISPADVEVSGRSPIKADAVLIATGRTPNTDWLSASGVKCDASGAVTTDVSLRTSLSSVYACGDVSGGYQFTHVAEYEATYAASNALFDWTKLGRKPNYRAIPWTIFTSPEIAQVGLSVDQATDKHEITHVALDEVDRAKTDGQTLGGIWMITKGRKGLIVGVTIISPQAGSLIGEATLAITQKLTAKAIFGTIHVYPTYGVLFARAAAAWQKNHASQRLLALSKRIQSLLR